MRPLDLAQDDSPHVPVVAHAVQWLESNWEMYPEYIFLLQPTSPLRLSQDIDEAVRVAMSKDADAVVSVCESC